MTRATSHVAPHRWADALAGRLDARELETMESHAASCATCTKARSRVERASQSFPALRAQSAPDLGWDSVRARVHWSVSSETRAKRAKQRTGRSRWLPAIAMGAFAAGAAVLAVSTGPLVPADAPRVGRVEAPVHHEPAPPAPLAPLAPLRALVVREVGDQTMINGLVRREIFEHALGAGAVIATGKSTLDVQFGSDSALALGPTSKLRLTRFDSETIELALGEGTVDVVVSKRAANQRFLVVAGSRTIEVRGTQFRVTRDETRTHVACAHGTVVVRDASGEVVVDGDHALELAATAAISGARVETLSPDERGALTLATPHTLPVWTTPGQLVQTSSALEIATPANREVRVDGLEVGQGPLRVRVMPGRHTVETADAAGRFHRAGWVDASAGKAARLEVPPDAVAATGGAATRRKQLRAGIDHAALASCTRAMAKAGVAGAFVKIEIAVDETGAVGFLNVIDTDLPSTTSSCVRDVLVNVSFKAGPAATFRDTLEL
jgi:ferric-dicitrate binding protein FerR (iron transport regulator)